MTAPASTTPRFRLVECSHKARSLHWPGVIALFYKDRISAFIRCDTAQCYILRTGSPYEKRAIHLWYNRYAELISECEHFDSAATLESQLEIVIGLQS